MTAETKAGASAKTSYLVHGWLLGVEIAAVHKTHREAVMLLDYLAECGNLFACNSPRLRTGDDTERFGLTGQEFCPALMDTVTGDTLVTIEEVPT